MENFDSRNLIFLLILDFSPAALTFYNYLLIHALLVKIL